MAPSTSVAGTRRPSKRTTPWPPVKQLSSASICRSITISGWSMSARNMVDDPSSMRAMMIAKPAPVAPVMNHLRPVIT
ncbi:hypothetical protein D3C85_575640 [compost metagenome]